VAVFQPVSPWLCLGDHLPWLRLESPDFVSLLCDYKICGMISIYHYMVFSVYMVLHGFYMVLVIVILSVCLSVCPSVTLVDCVHTVRPKIIISSPYGSPMILVSEDITFIPKFEGNHPERWR